MANGDNPQANLEANKQIAEMLARHLNLYKQRATAIRAEIDVLQQQTGIADKARLIVQKNLELQRNAIQAEQQALEKLQQQVAEKTRLQALESKSVEQIQRLVQLEGLVGDGIQKEIAGRQAALNLSRQAQEATENTVSATQRVVRTTLGISDAWKKTLVGSVAFGGSLNDIKQGLSASLNSTDAIMSSWMKIAEVSMKAALEYDNMAASVRRISGDAGPGDLAERTYDLHRSMLQYGVSVQDAGDATQSLYSGMASFSHLLPAAATSLQRQVALLKEVGVDSKSTAEALNFMDKGLRMSTSDSIALTNKLFGLSKSLKVPPEVIFRDWQSASTELAKYGAGMGEVFMGLSAQAKNTGLSMSQLLGIAKQFDEFDSAGRAVGRLNAILGGPYLNAIEMVYMTETQRIQAMRESISLSGAVYNDLSRHEKQTIAAAAGIRDMTVAAQLFGGTNRQFAEAASNQAELERRAKMSQSAMNKLKDAAMGLAIAVGPVVDGISMLASGLAKVASIPGGQALMTLTGLLAPLAVGYYKVTSALTAHKAMQALVTALTVKNTAAVTMESRGLDVSTGSIQRNSAARLANIRTAENFFPALRRSNDEIIRGGTSAGAATGPMRGFGLSVSQVLQGGLGFVSAFMAVNSVLQGTIGYAGEATAIVAGLALATMALKWAPKMAFLGPFAPFAVGAGMGIAAAGVFSAITKAQGVPRRQEGGPVEEGQPYMVGEAGPEVIVPSQGGTVVDNKGTEEMLGGGGAMMGELRDAITNLSMRLDNVGQGGGGSQAPIVIELDGEVVGRHSVAAVDKTLTGRLLR